MTAKRAGERSEASKALACVEVALALGYLRQSPLLLVGKLNHVIGVLVKLVR